MKCPACCDDLVMDPGGDPEPLPARCQRCAAGVLAGELERQQGSIDEVGAAFERIPAAVFGAEADRGRARAALVREGVFRELVGAREARQSAPALVALALQRPGVRAVPNHRTVLLAWLEALGPPRKAPPALQRDAREPGSIMPPPRGRGGRPRLDHRWVLEKVTAHLRLVGSAIAAHAPARAWAMVEELVAFQLRTGKPIHLVKSLCSLAMDAQRHGEFELQVDLLRRATHIKGDDAWTWAQLGKALCNVARYDEAAAAYDNASLFGQPGVARKGKADVLKTMGRLDDARIAYQEAMAQDPSDPVAKTGYADVLKLLGRFDEALDVYARIAAEHPESVFAKTGRADVLKVMGRLDEALLSYELAGREHPGCVVAKTGRARVLEAMGRVDEALGAFELAVREHPLDAGVRIGRDHLLSAMGLKTDAPGDTPRRASRYRVRRTTMRPPNRNVGV